MELEKAPLYSFRATGQIGGMYIADSWGKKKTLRKKVPPTQKNSPEQMVQRGKYREARLRYITVKPGKAEKVAYNTMAETVKWKLNCFNFFVKMYLIMREYTSFIPYFHNDKTSYLSPSLLHLQVEAETGLSVIVIISPTRKTRGQVYGLTEIPGTGRYTRTINNFPFRQVWYWFTDLTLGIGHERGVCGLYRKNFL